MIRRQFLKLATITGATGITSFSAIEALKEHEVHAASDAKATETVIWHVSGFTCVTCAVGLETLLRQEKGVVKANASYPNASVTIQYHPDVVNQAALRATVAELGFKVDEDKS
jgi:copper chaperone CopZ